MVQPVNTWSAHGAQWHEHGYRQRPNHAPTIDRVVSDVPRKIADEATKMADKIERGGPPDEDPGSMTAKIEDPDVAP